MMMIAEDIPLPDPYQALLLYLLGHQPFAYRSSGLTANDAACHQSTS
jgi:hypothetical protein